MNIVDMRYLILPGAKQGTIEWLEEVLFHSYCNYRTVFILSCFCVGLPIKRLLDR